MAWRFSAIALLAFGAAVGRLAAQEREKGSELFFCCAGNEPATVSTEKSSSDPFSPLAPPAAAPADKNEQKQPAVVPISGPRDLLRRHDVDDSQFDRLTDGQPIGDDDNETLLKVMFWLREFAPGDIERWARRQWDLAELVKQGKSQRGEIFVLAGQVTKVELLKPLPEVAERFEMNRYYRCELLLKPAEQPAIVLAENVPQAWQAGATIDARGGAMGLLMKFASDDPQQPVPVFVAPRVAWYPHTPLGDLGVDVGLLDRVENEQPLTSRDREAFYQVLAAAGGTSPGQLLRLADEQLQQAEGESTRTDKEGKRHFSVVPLFNQPQQQRGRLVVLEGTARRVEEIRVDDADIRARFGIDHYYQVALFTDDSSDERGPHPLFFCVRELPEGMKTSEGGRYGETIRVAGFFFKTWGFRVLAFDEGDQAKKDAGTRRQLAPLLIGRDLRWYPAPKPQRRVLLEIITGGLFAAAVAVLLGALWLGHRRQRAWRKMREKVRPEILAAPPTEGDV